MTDEILRYWFGDIQNGLSPVEKSTLWYLGGVDIDAEITQKFGATLKLFESDDLTHWGNSVKDRLAAIIVTDQFSRNIHRGQRSAFAFDEIALKICLQGIQQGADSSLSLVERVFYYHPLEHSENLMQQDLAVELMGTLLKSTRQNQEYVEEIQQLRINFAENALKYVKQHRDIIARFGRFPHRNAVLGRQSTEEEMKWLEEGGNRFGQ